MSRLRRLGRATLAFAFWVGLLAVFVTSAVASTVLHMNLPVSRRVARTLTNRLLPRVLQGPIVVGEIDRLGLDGVVIRGVDTYDPDGEHIIHADDLRASASVPAILENVLFRPGELLIEIPHVRLATADVTLLKGADGVPTIAVAFLPRPGPAPPVPVPTVGRGVRVLLDRVQIDHIWAHGDIAAPCIDADLSHVVARLEVNSDSVDLDVDPTGIEMRAPLPMPVVGRASFGLRHPRREDTGTRMPIAFDGKLGDLPVRATAQLVGARLAGMAHVEHATAGAIASLIAATPPPDIPLRVPVSAVIVAEGDLPELMFLSTLTFDRGGWLSAQGSTSFTAPMILDIGVGLHELDPAVVLGLAAPMSLSGESHLFLALASPPTVDVSIKTEPFAVAGNHVPPLDATATRSSEGAWMGAFDLHEPGAPIHGDVSADPRTGSVDFAVAGRVASLRAVKRLSLPVDGAADLRVKGSLRGGRIHAEFHGGAHGVRAPGAVRLDVAGVDGRLDGPVGGPAMPDLDATLWGRGLHAGSYAWQTMTVRASGAALMPHVQALFDAGGGASLAISGAIDGRSRSASDVSATLVRPDGMVTGKLARIAATSGGVRIVGIDVSGSGVGKVQGDLAISDKEVTGKIRGEDVDLEKVARLASYPGHLAGLMNADVDLSSSQPGQRSGHVDVEFVGVDAGTVRGASGVVTATFTDDRVRVDGLLRLIRHASASDKPEERCDGEIAQLRITNGDVRSSGPLLEAQSWTDASGRVEIAGDDWNLRCVRPLVPGFAQVPTAGGKLTTRVTLERAKGARFPTLTSFFARTRGLQLIANTWTSLHTDLEVTGSLDGGTGATEVKVAVLDGAPLASASMRTTLDLPTFLEHRDNLADRLRSTPVHATFDVPRRPVTAFAGLPTFLTDRVPLLTGAGGDTVTGDVQLTATLDGTASAPKLSAQLQGYGIAHVTLGITADKPGGSQPSVKPALGNWGMRADVDAAARYDGSRASLDATIKNGGRVVTRAKADIGLPVAALLAGQVKPSGRFDVDLDRFPIGEIPLLGDNDVNGALTGKVAMEGIGESPSLKVDVHLDGLKIGRELAYERASLTLDTGRATTSKEVRSAAKLALELASKDAGNLKASGTSEVKWEHGIIPVIASDRPVKLELSAQRFRIAAAQPLVRSVIGHLDGRIDGNAAFALGRAGEKGASLGKIQLALTGGVFDILQIGQELHDVTFDIAGDHAGSVKLSNFHARGVKGQITGSGSAQFDGLTFRKAELGLEISKDGALPVTFAGTPIGEASGTIKLGAEAQKSGQLDLKIGLPSVRLTLAPSLGRQVQSDDDNKDVTIFTGVHAPPPAVQTGGGRKIVIMLDPVNIAVKGSILGKVPIDGTVAGSKAAPIRVELGGDHARVSGMVDIPHLTLDLLHKEFVVDNATVKLNPDDASRSFVNATARWDSPDQSSFFINFVGEATPISADKLKDKLKCRSANLSQEQCFSALISAPDAAPIGTGATTSQGLAAQVISAAFTSDIGGGVSTTVGTAADGSLRPGLEYNLGRAVVEVSTYGISNAYTAPAGGAPAAMGQHELITIDWRFWRGWSIRGKFDFSNLQDVFGGDILWQHRY